MFREIERAIRRMGAPILAILVLATPARADLHCRAEVDRDVAAVGDQVVLTLFAEGDVNQQPRHDQPVINGADVVPGGTSQRYSRVAGGTRLAVSATYYLRLLRAGKIEIPPVVFTSGGETCQTDPLSVQVAAGTLPPSQTGNRNAAPRRAPADEEERNAGIEAGAPGDPAFITLTVDKDAIWVGEQATLVFRYFRRLSSWGQPNYTPPRTEGFWRLDLPPERNFRRTVRGQVYDVTEIRYALFPTRAGDVTIEPAVLAFPGDPFDRFFGRRGRSGPRRLKTAPIDVTVRDLPLPRPPKFSGIVADQLTLTATVDRDTVPRGEPVALTLEVSADGFLKSFTGLDLPESEHLRLHDAAENLREDISGPRYAATFSQEKAVVPTREGTMTLPSLDLVYFDCGEGRYRTAHADAPPLVVTPSDMPVAGDDPSGFRRTEIARLGRDLAFIHTAAGPLRRLAVPLPGHPLWWAVLLAPWLLLGLYRLRLRREDAARRDPVGRRRRLAWSRARDRLRRLERGGDATELARTILAFVGDRSGGSPAGLTGGDVVRWATIQGHAAHGERLAAILSACDQARFGGEAALDVALLAREVGPMLEDLGRSADRRGKGGAATVLVLLTMVGALGTAGTAGAADAADVEPAVAAAPGVDPARLLAEGSQAYTDGDLAMARQRYREALERGADDAVLHYNLGNVHARLGELGRAIVCYMRALRLAPRDADARTNLAWVRSHTRDLELAGQGLPPVVAQLDAVVHRLSLDEWSWILAALSWLTAALVGWAWRRGWLAGAQRRVLLSLAGALLLVAVVSATRWYEERWRDTAVVVVEEVEVRSGPATTFPVVFRIHDGLTLAVRGEREGWVRIGLGGDWVGWVPDGTLERVRRQPVRRLPQGR